MPVRDHAWGRPRVLMLCAGQGRRLGRRLGPDGSAGPKVLLRFGGHSLLERHLRHLEAGGAGRVTLVVGNRH